jgi:hypothetical protein
LSRQLAEAARQFARHGSRFSVSNLSSIHFDDRHNFGRTAREETLIGNINVMLAEWRLVNADSCASG